MKLLKRSIPLRVVGAEQPPRTRRPSSPEDAESALLREYQAVASENCFVGTDPRFTGIAIERQRMWKGNRGAFVFENVRDCWALWDDDVQVHEFKVRLSLDEQRDWVLSYLMVGADFHLRETYGTEGLIRRRSTLDVLQSAQVLQLLLVATGLTRGPFLEPPHNPAA